jgi:Ca2+/Na+ antiporter
MLEQLGLLAKKYFFAAILIITGLVLVIIAVTPEAVIEKTQSSWFLMGGASILVAGIVTLLYVLEIISKFVHFAVMIVLFAVCAVLTVLSVQSLEDTMEKLKLQEAYEKNAKQSLEDIRTIQLAYKKSYGKFAPDFTELKRFINEDEVYRTIPKVLHPSGKIPDRQPNAEEIAILGYDPFADEALIKDGIDEAEAIKLGYFKVDTIWVPVLESLFFSDEVQTSEVIRRYPFDPSKVDVVRTPNDSLVNFIMQSKEIDSTTNAFTVYDPYAYNPFKEKNQPRDTMRLGNLNDGSTNGSWEQ